jgi:hypothetical protein
MRNGLAYVERGRTIGTPTLLIDTGAIIGSVERGFAARLDPAEQVD